MTLSAFSFGNDPELLEEIERTGTAYSFHRDDIIVQNEKYVRLIPLIVKGSAKVLRVDPDGKELFLYHISAGETCAVGIASYLSHQQCCVKAVAEEETEVIALPAAACCRWFSQFPAWRAFAMNALSEKMNVLMNVIDTIAFTRTDQRLMTFLSIKSKALKSNIIHITHQEIANELSTSREVVSRLLKRLEQEQEVRLFRNKIELNFTV